MKYPDYCKTIVDVTKAPYFADNSGKTDCTAVLRQVFDDLLSREIKGISDTKAKLDEMGENDVYIGFENRKEDGHTDVIFPEFVPDARIIYFPSGVYLISDTLSYTFKDFKNILKSKYFSELARGIHIMGEKKENTVIRLKDYSLGFDTEKYVVSNIMNDELTNIGQLNTVLDITVDCGKGNPGAVALHFNSNNSGRIENVNIVSSGSKYGISAKSCDGCFKNIEISGFEYGIYSKSGSPAVYENLNFSNIKNSAFLLSGGRDVFRNINSKDSSLVCFENESGNGSLFENCNYPLDTDVKNNAVCVYDNGKFYKFGAAANNSGEPYLLKRKAELPNSVCPKTHEWVCVDDFGAIGDGKTDSTLAIQKAFESGNPYILFGDGHYLVDKPITVPKTVKAVDFMFCDLFAGENLKGMKNEGLFVINEESKDLIEFRNLYTFEQFYGYMHLIKHSAKRDILMRDLHTQTAALYFNTVGGSTVWIDNCACTTGTFSQDYILSRVGHSPEYSSVIPFEFHHQTVYAFHINPERADIEVLNDGGSLLIYGLKVEGPGTAVKTVNGGISEVYTGTAGIGKNSVPNAVFETEYSDALVAMYRVFGIKGVPTLDYNNIIEELDFSGRRIIHKSEIDDPYKTEYSRCLNFYSAKLKKQGEETL